MTLGYVGKQSETGSYHVAQGGLKLMTFFFLTTVFQEMN